MQRPTIILILLLTLKFTTIPVLSQVTSCKNLRDIPINTNENYDDTRYFSGCITNTSFPNEVVTELGIDCTSNTGVQVIEELPKNFLSHLYHLNELIINQCSIKTIRPEAFSNLPAISSIDLTYNRLSSIPASVFNWIPSLKYLNISHNAIVFIEDLAFARLPLLADLDLSFNQLGSLNRACFTNTTSIEEFFVQNNLVREIPEHMFSGWKTTYAFNFDYNEISKIQVGAFVDVATEINYLSLRHNRLTSINLEAFIPKRSADIETTSILQLDISGNFLNYLPLDFFKRIPVKHLWIFGNPLECSCLRIAENVLQTRRIKIESVYLDPSDANDKCRRFDVPVCASVPSTESRQICSGTENNQVSKLMKDNVQKLGFGDLREWYEQCAVLPGKAYLDASP